MPEAWVYAEVTPAGVADPTALELLTRARSLGAGVAAVALGPGAGRAAETLGNYGASKVYLSDDEVFGDFLAQPATEALYRLVTEHSPDLLLFATNYDSRDIAGRLSARTGATLVSNATGVSGLDRAQTSISGGSLEVDVALQGSLKIVLVRPKSFIAEATDGVAEVIRIDADVPEELRQARRVERHEQDAAGPKLEDAGIVVAGGRGLQEPDNFKLLEELASLLDDCAVGATRAVVDAGWVPYAYQIGQTGKTIKPGVYIAAGISGATQHLVGMKGAKRIVAINKDADAPIFEVADLQVVGDATKVLERLIEEVKGRKGKP
jgi:electron transfer flavoprotein alpha subunit